MSNAPEINPKVQATIEQVPPTTQDVPKEPALRTFDIAEQQLEQATTYSGKVRGIKAASIAITELNIKRLRNMLVLLDTLETEMVERVLSSELDQDQLMALYMRIAATSATAHRQVTDTLKQISDEDLMLLMLGDKTTPEEEDPIQAANANAAQILRELSSGSIELTPTSSKRGG